MDTDDMRSLLRQLAPSVYIDGHCYIDSSHSETEAKPWAYNRCYCSLLASIGVPGGSNSWPGSFLVSIKNVMDQAI